MGRGSINSPQTIDLSLKVVIIEKSDKKELLAHHKLEEILDE